MRQASKKCLFWVVILLLLATGGVACMRDLLPELPEGFGFGLSVKPQIFRGPEGNLHGRTTETKANKDDDDTTIKQNDGVYGRDELWENYYRTLDIFVKKSTDGDDASWHKQYHLVAGQGVITDPNRYGGTGLLDQAKQLLTRSWEEDYHQGESYDIYVTANNPHTVAGTAPANLTALKALSTHTDNMFQYNAESAILSDNWAGTVRPFIMDGKKTGWQIEYDTGGNPLPEQVFDVNLERAAAKIILNVRFSDAETFPKVPLSTVDNPNPDPELDSLGRIIYVDIQHYLSYIKYTAGEPRCKTVNFNYDVSDIKDGNTPSPEQLETLDGNFLMKQYGTSEDNCDNTYSMVTYTYPIDWTGDTDSNRIPFILLSIYYTSTEDANKQLRCYYRIPVCDEASVTKLERNHIYIVDAEIASLGSFNENLETQDEQLRLEYHVVPWTETDISQEATSVRLSDTKYLTVTPTTYTLKGDGTQKVDLQWYASVSINDKRYVDIDVSTLNISYVNYQGNSVSIQGNPTKQIRNADNTLSTSNDNNTDGSKDIVITSTATGTGTNSEKVIITITPDGLIEVSSDVLLNRAVKKIAFDVKLKNAEGAIDAIPITIYHYPLDNIKSIEGWFSYKLDAVGTVREYSFNPNGDGWTSWDGYEDEVECTEDEYNYASGPKVSSTESKPTGSPSNYDSMSDIESGGNRSMQTDFRDAVPQSSRQGANSEANAYKDPDSNYWYWGTGSQQLNNGNNGYDWRRWSLYRFEYYRFETYNRRIYYKNTTVYKARRYYRDVQQPTTNWVIWDRDSQTRYPNSKTVSDHMMYAKVLYNDRIYNIEQSSNYNGYIATRSNSATNYTNPQMYVIQLTSTSDEYAIGYPVISNYESQDKVVSPAFMLASQLGALTTSQPLSFENAKEHCGKYIEVGTDGYVYTNWRLPTVGEIETIIKYQGSSITQNITMATVLTGRYYWALDGTSPLANSSDTREYYWVRCVRDLTLSEINRLNND